MNRLPAFALLAFLGIPACADSISEPRVDPVASVSLKTMADGGGHWMESVTGSGHFVTGPLAYVPGAWRTFTMTAEKARDESVEGKFQILVHVGDGPPTIYKGPITCFTITGNVAWVGAHLNGNDPPDIAFQVVDNGEGSGADPDRVGLFVEGALFGLPAGFAQRFCDDTPVFLDELPPPYNTIPIWVLLSDVVAGNIQIKAR